MTILAKKPKQELYIPPSPFIGGKVVYVGGNLGKGKTVTTVKCLWEDYLIGKQIYADFQLDFPGPEELPNEPQYRELKKPQFLSIKSNIDLRRFINMMESGELEDCTVAFDEAYLTASNNRSQSIVNQLVVAYATTVRKRAADLYLISPEEGDIERKVRRYIHIEMYPNYNEETGICSVKVYNRQYKKWTILRYDAREIFPLYNTREKPALPTYLKRATFR